jgi:carboxyl-terminal processing protease
MKWNVRSMSLVGAGAMGGLLISLGLTALAQRTDRGPLPLEEIRSFTDVFGAVKANYVEPVDDKKLIAGAIQGMLGDLDPHSQYLDADAFKELQAGTTGEFGGLGIEIGQEDGFVKVQTPIEDTPASRAGIKSGDLIVRIDDKSTKGLTLSEAVKLMKGKPKTPVTLTITRKDNPVPIVFTIVRDIIKIQSVRTRDIEPGFAYMRVSQFQERTVENLVTKLNEAATKQPNMKGLVLDLRNDPGGLLHGAIGVSAIFLPKDELVVSTEGRTEENRRKYFATPEDYRGLRNDPLRGLNPIFKTVPMVVLVNQGTASASEIVAGALQDHGRAKVVGTGSFGKGSVQTIFPLSQTTGIKLTTARYFTPKGRSIQAKGIEPDFLVEETAEGDVFASLFRREADIEKHLTDGKPVAGDNRTAEQRAKELADRAAKIEQLRAEGRKPIEPGSAEDFQLAQALNLLKGLPVQVAKAKPEVASAEKAVEKSGLKAGEPKPAVPAAPATIKPAEPVKK